MQQRDLPPLSHPSELTSASGNGSRNDSSHQQLTPSKSSLIGTTCSSTGFSLVCPSSASQDMQTIVVAIPAQTIVGTIPSNAHACTHYPHKRLHLPRRTFSLCPNYGENRGKCEDPGCKDLHVCRSWLAGYARMSVFLTGSCVKILDTHIINDN